VLSFSGMSKPVLFHSHTAAILAAVSYGAVALSELSLAVRTLRAGFAGVNRRANWGLVLGPALGIFLGVRVAHGVPSLTLPGSGWWPFALGLVLIWTGLVLRRWAVLELGRFFQLAVVVQEDHRVVDTGPYRVVRHPSYSGLLLIFLGFGFTLGNWLSVTSCLVLPLLGLLPRIRAEEALLARALGDPYRAYAARTRRLVPRVW
jgi:protein-S-isoprenylcysteine O-methyltransferase Ste14